MGLRRAGGHMLVCVLSQATSLQSSGFRAQIHTLTPLPGPPTNRSHPAGPVLVKGRWTRQAAGEHASPGPSWTFLPTPQHPDHTDILFSSDLQTLVPLPVSPEAAPRPCAGPLLSPASPSKLGPDCRTVGLHGGCT